MDSSRNPLGLLVWLLKQNVAGQSPTAMGSLNKGVETLTSDSKRIPKALRESQSNPSETNKVLALSLRCLEACNELLFNLGILILEVGYGRPWYKLKQAETSAPES